MPPESRQHTTACRVADISSSVTDSSRYGVKGGVVFSIVEVPLVVGEKLCQVGKSWRHNEQGDENQAHHDP